MNLGKAEGKTGGSGPAPLKNTIFMIATPKIVSKNYGICYNLDEKQGKQLNESDLIAFFPTRR